MVDKVYKTDSDIPCLPYLPSPPILAGAGQNVKVAKEKRVPNRSPGHAHIQKS